MAVHLQIYTFPIKQLPTFLKLTLGWIICSLIQGFLGYTHLDHSYHLSSLIYDCYFCSPQWQLIAFWDILALTWSLLWPDFGKIRKVSFTPLHSSPFFSPITFFFFFFFNSKAYFIQNYHDRYRDYCYTTSIIIFIAWTKRFTRSSGKFYY